MKQINMSKKDEPIVCPLLSMAAPQAEEFTDCAKEACWFYSRKMKMCAIVIQALAQSNIAMYLSKTSTMKDFDRIMDSAKRQHRSL
jgi:hypothetical protein